QQMGGPGQNNPFNTIYTDISIGQAFLGNKSNITSATYYLDDPENLEAFQELAKEKSNIDFETYALDANDRLYQQNINSLENTQSFSTMFLIVVIGAGSAVLCLVLILTIRNRYYEIGLFLSLGQSKFKIILQQLFEMLMIAAVAFVISLGTGKMVSNIIGNMLESGTNNNQFQMEIPVGGNDDAFENNFGGKVSGIPMFNDAFNEPENSELDVSLTASTVRQLAGITIVICLVSIAIPSTYVLRLSPREILVKKEG
ncbi:ABC transporter permease, partial [Thomasclavelia cocleata]